MLGVISDTHGNEASLLAALALFKESGITRVLHAGDLGDPSLLDCFEGFTLHMAKGNCDDLPWLAPHFARHRQPPPQEIWELEDSGKTIFLMHGDDARLYRRVIEEGRFDYLIKGHTHFPEDYIRNKTRVLNPGALYRSPRYSVALFDPAKDRWELREISKGGNK